MVRSASHEGPHTSSVANAAAIGAGTAQSGFVQSDVAQWAYEGTGIFEGRPKIESLRAICNLYPESFHLVARAFPRAERRVLTNVPRSARETDLDVGQGFKNHYEETKFQAEVAELLNLMVHSVYSETDVFLRELISNASDALDKRRFEALKHPDMLADGTELHIQLVPDTAARTAPWPTSCARFTARPPSSSAR
mgnify:CR=1 FL=1